MVGARRPRGRHGPDVVLSLTDEERARFAYHPATPATGPLHDAVRTAALAYATALAAVVPAGRHRALALTSVQESMMWANAGIACDTPRPEGPVATEPGCSHPECTLTHPHAGPAVLRAREDG